MPESELIKRAREFATRAHEGQVRKYTGEFYITHCANVADIVAAVGGSETQIAAAWLHDTVEDCKHKGITHEVILFEFGEEVAGLVENLTDISQPLDGNRARRKEIDRNHIAMASPAAKTIKLADLIDNTRSIVRYDPNFAVVYLKEKLLLLEVLKEGDSILWVRAERLADEGMNYLESIKYTLRTSHIRLLNGE